MCIYISIHHSCSCLETYNLINQKVNFQAIWEEKRIIACVCVCVCVFVCVLEGEREEPSYE